MVFIGLFLKLFILKLSLGFGLSKSKFTRIATMSVVIVLFTTPAYVSYMTNLQNLLDRKTMKTLVAAIVINLLFLVNRATALVQTYLLSAVTRDTFSGQRVIGIKQAKISAGFLLCAP